MVALSAMVMFLLSGCSGSAGCVSAQTGYQGVICEAVAVPLEQSPLPWSRTGCCSRCEDAIVYWRGLRLAAAAT